MAHPSNIKFARLYASDKRDRLFSASVALESDPHLRAAKPRVQPWRLGPVLDQGNTPQCVAFSARGWMDSAPVMDAPSLGPTTDELYAGAQEYDEFPGSNYEGTTVRGVLKYLQTLNLVAQYLWIESVDVLIQYVLAITPVMLGTDWFEGMMEPDETNTIHATGSVVGGHAYYAYWYEEPYFRIRNSWGEWGRNGHARLHRDDAAILLNRQGEAVAALERKVIPHAVP